MAPNMPEGKFVTMLSYLYDPDTGELHVARAGHPPGLLLHRKSNAVTRVLGDGFAVGFFEEGSYSMESHQLDPGDIFLVYTDAIPESVGMRGEAYGIERAEELLLRTDPEKSAAEVLGDLLEDFDQFREGRVLKDDVTVIALKRTP